jgi:hypothetical protein
MSDFEDDVLTGNETVEVTDDPGDFDGIDDFGATDFFDKSDGVDDFRDDSMDSIEVMDVTDALAHLEDFDIETIGVTDAPGAFEDAGRAGEVHAGGGLGNLERDDFEDEVLDGKDTVDVTDDLGDFEGIRLIGFGVMEEIDGLDGFDGFD